MAISNFKPAAFSKTAKRNLADPDLDSAIRADLEYAPHKVTKISRKARRCQARDHDEDTWCDNVVRPIVRLALRLYAKGKPDDQSVYLCPFRPT